MICKTELQIHRRRFAVDFPDVSTFFQTGRLQIANLRPGRKRQLLPTVSALGVAGDTPLGSSQYFTARWYSAVGVNIGVPIFDGFHFHAQAAEAEAQARVAAEHKRDLQNRIARTVRIAWNIAAAARQRVDVTAELLSQSRSQLNPRTKPGATRRSKQQSMTRELGQAIDSATPLSCFKLRPVFD